MKYEGVGEVIEPVDLSTRRFHFEGEDSFVEDSSDDDRDDASCSYSTDSADASDDELEYELDSDSGANAKKLKTGSSKQAASAISLVNRDICQGKASSTDLSSNKRKAVEVVTLLSSDDESTSENVQRKVAKNDVVGDESPCAKVSFFFVVKPFLKRLA